MLEHMAKTFSKGNAPYRVVSLRVAGCTQYYIITLLTHIAVALRR